MAKQQTKRFSTVKAAYVTAFVIAVLGITVSLGGVAVAWAQSVSSNNYIANIANATFEAGSQLGSEATFGGGSRFPNGLSADSTSPSAGEVRGTTLTSTGAATIGSTLGVTATSTLSNDLLVSGTSIFATSTATTSPQIFVGAAAGVSTTTVQIGHQTGPDFCIQGWENGAVYKIYLNGTSLVVEAGLCVD